VGDPHATKLYLEQARDLIRRLFPSPLVKTLQNGKRVKSGTLFDKESLTSASIDKGPTKESSTIEMHANLRISEQFPNNYLHLTQPPY
jgi:hypothetical protein